MNTPTENQSKNSILKSLAVGGFIGLIIVIAWLGVQLVGVLPKAFSSLASIANTVYNHEEVTIKVKNDTEVSNSGESFGLSWNVPKTPGDFMFSYTCTDGVAVDVETAGSGSTPVPCGQQFRLGSVSGTNVTIHSEKNRFTDIPYTVSFVPRTEGNATSSTNGTLTVVNASIATPPLAVTPDTPATSTPPIIIGDATPPTNPISISTTTKPKPTPKPIPTKTFTYAIPVSNPNGFTDLSVKLTRIGTVSNGAFLSSGTIDNDMSAALLFEVKNIGSKTSNSFSYTVTLPNGSQYTSPVQPALKPNERASIALGFDVTNTTGLKSFSVSVQSSSETTTANNGFTGSVVITD